MPEESNARRTQVRRDQEARPDNSTPENEYGPEGGSNLEAFMESLRDSEPGADSADDASPDDPQPRARQSGPGSDSADDVPRDGRNHS